MIIALNGIPKKELLPIAVASVWTWVIEGGLATGWTLFLGFYMNDALVELWPDQLGLVTLVEGAATGAWGTMGLVWIRPGLDRLFNQKPPVLAL